MILDFEADKEVPIILGRPFLATRRTLIDVQKVSDLEDLIVEKELTSVEDPLERILTLDPPNDEEEDEYLALLEANQRGFNLQSCFESLELEKREYAQQKASIEEQSKLELKCVPKKGGITVVKNENNELIPTRTITRWRIFINYQKLNKATRKDHFPLPFLDQMPG
ncbi:uncharacterized protein LOC108450926 [Gossypium arboreum]|uniref:uncharacterized protein LOC108450926 n=1 Tax=Gossypium arboreum TaxID=29729 RepID=UPI000819714F|nr:uncharacterized protein LOC108450926 [Gossypium arboreum]